MLVILRTDDKNCMFSPIVMCNCSLNTMKSPFDIILLTKIAAAVVNVSPLAISTGYTFHSIKPKIIMVLTWYQLKKECFIQ